MEKEKKKEDSDGFEEEGQMGNRLLLHRVVNGKENPIKLFEK